MMTTWYVFLRQDRTLIGTYTGETDIISATLSASEAYNVGFSRIYLLSEESYNATR